jgi:Bacterial PH domain
MSYSDSLMSTGERVERRQRQHWLVMVWGARYAILAMIAALLLFVLGGNLSGDGASGTFRGLLGLLTAALFLGGLAVFAWNALRYMNQEYVLTNRRVIQVEGVVNKRATDSSLEKINDAALSQTIFGRMFGFGDLDVLTAAEAGIERFRMIVDPVGFKRSMLDAKHEYEIEMSGRAMPSPPLRAPVAERADRAGRPGGQEDDTSSVAVAAPVASSAAASTSGWGGNGAATGGTSAGARMSPDEVTRTLASLADLRDRNAISAEEYEAKKVDLLARL